MKVRDPKFQPANLKIFSIQKLKSDQNNLSTDILFEGI